MFTGTITGNTGYLAGSAPRDYPQINRTRLKFANSTFQGINHTQLSFAKLISKVVKTPNLFEGPLFEAILHFTQSFLYFFMQKSSGDKEIIHAVRRGPVV